MAKFIYRMQNILNLKEKLEEEAKNAYVAQLARVHAEEDRLQALIERKEEYEEEGRRIRLQKLNVRDLEENEYAVSTMKGMIEAQRRVLSDEEAVLDEKRGGYEEAMKERKTQDKLKEKAFEAFKVELNMQESKEIDELTSYVYGNRIRLNRDETGGRSDG